MKRAALLAVAIGLVSACNDGDTARRAFAARLASAHAAEAEESSQTNELRRQADALSREIGQLAADLRVAEASYRRAGGLFAEASEHHEHAMEAGREALDHLQETERNYRRLASIVVAAAVADVAGWQLCEGAMSTQSYRASLRARGISLEGRDIDHVLPHSLGGANHPLNYQPLESSLNRSLGADILPKIATQPIALLQGLTVSALMRLQCGNNPRAFGR